MERKETPTRRVTSEGSPTPRNNKKEMGAKRTKRRVTSTALEGFTLGSELNLITGLGTNVSKHASLPEDTEDKEMADRKEELAKGMNASKHAPVDVKPHLIELGDKQAE